MRTIRPSSSLANVRYEIRGDLARRAHEMERLGYEIIPLNIGNPGLFGFRTPETMRLAMIENLKSSEAYCHQKGVFPAREAVVMQQQSRGVRGVSADEVFMGNGVSELIDLVLRALLSTDDEVLVPSPDYPLWTAAVTLNRGRAVHYPCRPENGFEPDPRDIEALITSRTRAIVVINPNNPTGAVYSRATLRSDRADRRAASPRRVQRRDLRPDPVRRRRVRADGDAGERHAVRDARGLVEGVSRLRLSRRLGGVLGRHRARTRLSECAGQAVLAAPVQQRARAVGGADRARRLPEHLRADAPGGRLFQSRQAILDGVAASKYLQVHAPRGAIYAFVGVKDGVLPGFDDQQFAMDLLEHKHVLLAPGTSFNTPYNTHFRITNLPRPEVLADVFRRMEELLDSYAAGAEPVSRPAPELRIVTK